MDFEQNSSPQEPAGAAGNAENSTAGNPAGQRPLRDFKSVNPVKPVKVRRVGTLTLGLALVAAGVCLLLNAFVPNFPLATVAQFSPVILILIGLEILVSTLIYQGEKLRYDFLSMFVCFFLIIGSVGLSFIPRYVESMLSIEQAESRINQELEEDVYEALKGEPIDRLSTGFYLYENMVPWNEPVDPDLTYSDAYGAYLSVDVTLGGSYEGAEEFAAEAREVMDRLQQLDLPPDAYLYISDRNYEYQLHIYDLWEWDYTEEQIVENLSTY